MTTKQEDFDKLLEVFVSAHDDYRATLKRAESLGTDEAYADAEDARQHRDAARGAVCDFVFPPAPPVPPLRHPWEISAEEYVASVRDGSCDPGLFTAENGWHAGYEGDTSVQPRWRGAGGSAHPRNYGVVVCLENGEWQVDSPDRGYPRLNVADLAEGLARAKANPNYHHPLGLAHR